MKKALFRIIILLLAAVSLFSVSCAETDEEDEIDVEKEIEMFEEDYGYLCSVDQGTLVIRDDVITLGGYYGEIIDGDWENRVEDPEIAALFVRGPGAWYVIDGDFLDVTLSGIRWPSTFRILGEGSFLHVAFEKMTIPASIERIYYSAFYRCYFGTLRIESCLPLGEIFRGIEDCRIGAYEVPEDHPLYKTVDGVLYSKDGKTLLAYPNRRQDEHFDVPAGVECIDGFAFETEYLKTISLPIGLKSLDDYAFYGCTRLQSIAVPLTVEHIGTGVFDDCVSLERVSLPEGLEADKDDAWAVYYPDDSLYRGDNGDTLSKPAEDDGKGLQCAVL